MMQEYLDLHVEKKKGSDSTSQHMCKSLSRAWLFAILWTTTRHAPLSMGFARQEYWSGLPFPSWGDLPDPGIELESPALQADSLPLNHQARPWIDQMIFQGQFPELLYLFLFHYR